MPNLQYAVTDSIGKFHFALNDYYNGKELYLTIRNVPEGEQWKIVSDNSYALPEYWSTPQTDVDANCRNFFIKSQNIFQINKTYNQQPEFVEDASVLHKVSSPQMYYSKPVVVYPKDFVSLNDFLEISVELLPQVRITKKGTKYSLQVLGATTYSAGINETAVFLDGVYVDDFNKIIGLGTEKINKIELFNVERAIGNLVFQGVISISSKTNEIVRTVPATHSARVKYDNYAAVKQFVNTSVSEINNPKMPYVKQILYWNPDLTRSGAKNCDFEFYTSDNATFFIINVEGVTHEGTPVSAKRRIEVNNQLKPIN